MNEPELSVAVVESSDVVKTDKPNTAMTPAQARVDAVAALTNIALSRSATLQLTPDESARLTADFADADFRSGAAGKENLIYIEHAALRDRMNSVLGLGQWAIIVRDTWNEDFETGKGVKGVRVYARAMLLVRGCYVGEAVGDMDYWPSSGQQNYGDAFEGSKTAAFRRCAKEFGIGLQAWRKEWCEGWWARKRGQSQTAAPKPTPAAKPPEDRRTTLLNRIKGYEPEATEVFREELLVKADETFADITAEVISKISPESMVALIQQVKARRTDQIPGAESGDVNTGIVDRTSEKTATSKAGKPYTKYGVKIGETWHNTFSQSLRDKAESLKGVPVVFTATVNNFGSELQTIEAQQGT